MFNLDGLVNGAIQKFFENFFNDLIKQFANTLANIMGSSINVLQMPLVQNGMKYAQALAFTLLVAKSINEAFQTYILYQNGDPEADPSGMLIRVGQAVAIIAALPYLVQEIFIFGTKVATDVANLGTGIAGVGDWTAFIAAVVGTGGIVIIIWGAAIVILLLVVAIQATIRGGELALTSVLGPIMALNLTASNRSMWSAWFKQTVIICVSQAIQIFMLSGALAMLTSSSVSGDGLLLIIGWLWVTVKSPKFIQQFAYTTGFTGAVGGAGKQAGSMYLMRKMMVKG